MAGEEGGSRASATPADFVHSVTPNSGFAPRGKCLSCKIPSLPPNDPTLSVESDVLHAAPSKSPGQAARTDRSPAPRSWPGPIRPERVRRRRSPQGIESGLWGHLRLPVPQTLHATDSPCHRPPCHESSPTSTSASRGADSPRPCDGPTVEQATGAESICTRRRRSPALFGPNSPGVLGICQRTLSVPPAARRRSVGRSGWKSEQHR